MLTPVTGINGRQGLLNEETGKVVIPLEYKSISIQKYGIVAECIDNVHSYIFSSDATKLFKAYTNTLLLEDHLLLTCLGNLCIIMDYSDPSFVCGDIEASFVCGDIEADSILFFLGNHKETHAYTPETKIEDFLSDPTYSEFGAHLENRIALKSSENHLWGVFDRSRKLLHTDFNYPVMVQAKGDQIMVRKDGKPTML